ncbi:hypothetical protein, partial [Escherichia coli]|uniref:hypothetical protein n=1 Tax=Escherichia coli TaxID=562 RepID=UPI0013B3E13C
SKNIGVRVNYSKAVYAFNQQMAGNGSKVSHVFDSGFHLALMNTNLADWSDFRQAGTFTLDEAHVERARLVSIYEGMGLRNAGAQHIK